MATTDGTTQGKWGTFIPRERTNPSSEKRVLVLHPDGERVIADCSVGFINRSGPIPLEEREMNAKFIAHSHNNFDAVVEALDGVMTFLYQYATLVDSRGNDLSDDFSEYSETAHRALENAKSIKRKES